MQLALGIRCWGGKRVGAGRKRLGRASVPHVVRPVLSRHCPVHVTLRLAAGIESLRERGRFAVVREQLKLAKERLGFRLIHFSVQSNHLHLIAEADDREALSRGIKGLQVRVARALNKLLQRTGRVFGDRYHAHILKTPTEVRHAIAYVLQNAQKHGLKLLGKLDPFSSAHHFAGWKSIPSEPINATSPITKATTWLLNKGWKQKGPLDPSRHPAIRSPKKI